MKKTVFLIVISMLCASCTTLSTITFLQPESNGINHRKSIIQELFKNQPCNRVASECYNRYKNIFQYDIEGATIAIQLHNDVDAALAVGLLGIPFIPSRVKSGYGYTSMWLYNNNQLYVTIAIKSNGQHSSISYYPFKTIIELADGTHVKPERYAVIDYIDSSHFPEKNYASFWYGKTNDSWRLEINNSGTLIKVLLEFPVYYPPDNKLRVIFPPLQCGKSKMTIPPVQFQPNKKISYSFTIVPN